MTRNNRFSLTAMIFAMLAISSVAMAGKPERDAQKELTPKLAALKSDIKARCGCDLDVTVRWESYTRADDMACIEDSLNGLSVGTKKNCDDANEKKITCAHLKAYELHYEKKDGGSITYNNGTISCGTNDSNYCSDQMINQIVDPWS